MADTIRMTITPDGHEAIGKVYANQIIGDVIPARKSDDMMLMGGLIRIVAHLASTGELDNVESLLYHLEGGDFEPLRRAES